ncbi:MAG: S8 family serine peptidase [Candidatus Thorarchaeota archaeon]
MVVLFIFIFLMAIPGVVNAQRTDTAETKMAPEERARLAPGLLADLQETIGDKEWDVQVLCEGFDTLDYLLYTKQAVPGIHITSEWYYLGAFGATVNRNQLLKLSRLPFVIRIDTVGRDLIFNLDSARAQTHVDRWTADNPTIDGNLDGDPWTYSKDDVVIAVIDTGCDNEHVDLDEGKVLAFYDAAYPWNEVIDDYDASGWGHGTHVSSIAAGTGEGYYGIYRGVAPGAALVIVRVRDDSNFILAMEWVAAHKETYGIDIVTMSVSVHDSEGIYDNVAEMADRLVWEYGLIVTCAAGNHIPELGKGPVVRSPGTGKYVITVGNAIDPGESASGKWELADDSCHGPVGPEDRIKPDILAPGTNINAAMAHSTTKDEYHEGSGTSMATPFVAGLCALWLDRSLTLGSASNGEESDPLIKNLIMSSATDMPFDSNPGKDNYYGAGRVDAVDEQEFYVTDKSGNHADAPKVISKSWSDRHYYWTDPLWAGDFENMADWYKVECYEEIFIYAEAWGDPDLVLVLSIWEYVDNNLRKVAESYPGRVRNVGYHSDYEGTYFVKIEVHHSFSGSVSGDYYDIHILTTMS